MYHGIGRLLQSSFMHPPDKLMFRIRDKPFVPRYSDQAAVPEGSHNLMGNDPRVRKQAIVVVR
jgi:hypothetical protein